MTDALHTFIGSARWFGGKGRDFSVAEVRRLPWLDDGSERDGAPRVRIELVAVSYADAAGGTEVYQVPLAYYRELQERLDHAFVGDWDDEEIGHRYVYDALHDRVATHLWLEGFAEERSSDSLVFHRLPGHEIDLESRSALFSGEQSNSTLMFGEDCLMKVFRKVTAGRNPDIEIHEALTKAESGHVAALYGWIDAHVEGLPGVDSTEEPIQLAMLQQFLRTASDGWDLALASVRDLFAEADLHASEVGGDFASESYRLGIATAEVHEVLASHFPTEIVGTDRLQALASRMRDRLDAAVEVVPRLGEQADALRKSFAAIGELTQPVLIQRIHGDLHLGQTLRTVKGWKIVDFEGEPAKPLAERVRPDSPWRDVAGMLRSFDYAAHAVEADVEEGGRQIAYRALEWVERNQTAFLAGYSESRRDRGDPGDPGDRESRGLSPEEVTLLRAYVLDKAVYETVYEARNRPSWVGIPLTAVERLLQTSAPTTESSEVTDR